MPYKVAPFQSGIVLDCCQRIGRVHWSSVASDHFFPWVENAAYARFKIPSGDWESGSFVLYCKSMSAADGAPPGSRYDSRQNLEQKIA